MMMFLAIRQVDGKDMSFWSCRQGMRCLNSHWRESWWILGLFIMILGACCCVWKYAALLGKQIPESCRVGREGQLIGNLLWLFCIKQIRDLERTVTWVCFQKREESWVEICFLEKQGEMAWICNATFRCRPVNWHLSMAMVERLRGHH